MCGKAEVPIYPLPQMPSRQERRKVSVGSISFLILISASRTIGPQLPKSTSYVSTLGFRPSSGFQRYTLKLRTRVLPAAAGKCRPGWIFEFLGSVNSATVFDALWERAFV